jgi:hypothetical protein
MLGGRVSGADADRKQIGSAPMEFESFSQGEGLLRLVARGTGILIRKVFRRRDFYPIRLEGLPVSKFPIVGACAPGRGVLRTDTAVFII